MKAIWGDRKSSRNPAPSDNTGCCKMITITDTIHLPEHEIQIRQIHASGPGGQHVNKVASAVHLRFDVKKSSLPEPLKNRLLNLHDSRISEDGIIIIKAQRYKSLEKNKEDALQRLRLLINKSLVKQKKRVSTRPSRAAREKRLAGKQQRSQRKSQRRKVTSFD